jgi:hypothetical protein
LYFPGMMKMFSLEKFILYVMWWNLMPGQLLLFVSSRSVLNKEHMSSLNHWRSGGGGGNLACHDITIFCCRKSQFIVTQLSVQPSIKGFQKLLGGGRHAPFVLSPLAFTTGLNILYILYYLLYDLI